MNLCTNCHRQPAQFPYRTCTRCLESSRKSRERLRPRPAEQCSREFNLSFCRDCELELTEKNAVHEQRFYRREQITKSYRIPYCHTCLRRRKRVAQRKYRRRNGSARPIVSGSAYPQYYRWLAQMAAEVRRSSQ